MIQGRIVQQSAGLFPHSGWRGRSWVTQTQIKDRIGVVLDSGGFYEDLSLNEMKKILAPAYSSWCEEDYRSYLERFSLNPKEKRAK